MLRLNVAPGPFIDLVAPMATKAVTTAVKLGIFDVLGDGPLEASSVARRIGGDLRGTTLLLEALESVGYLRRNGAGFENSPMAAKWMNGDATTSLAGVMPHLNDMLGLWDNLDESIRLGGPAVDGFDFILGDPGRTENFHNAMRAMATSTSAEIVERVDVPPTARKLLDVGGSHGLFAIRFCQAHSGLSAVVLDWPQARELAEKTIEDERMAERVSFREGDFLEDDLGSGIDVALLFNIIHMFKADEVARLFARVHAAMSPGGLLLVMDQIGGEQPGVMGKAFGRLQALNQFNATSGQTYTAAEVEALLKGAGFSDTSSFALKRAPGQGVVRATKPA